MTQVLTIAYLLVALGAIRPIAGHFAWYWHHASVARSASRVDPYVIAARLRVGARPGPGRTVTLRAPDGPSGGQWFDAVVLAALVGALWPAAAIWALTGALGPVGAERRQRLLERERHVADLEATLDLQGDPHP